MPQIEYLISAEIDKFSEEVIKLEAVELSVSVRYQY